jgi:hypothetical protein
MGRTLRANVGEPSPQWKADTRAQLMATIERDGIQRDPATRAQTTLDQARVETAQQYARASSDSGHARLKVRGAILVGLAFGTLALSGMSAASGSANPGDALYGVKRSHENAQLALARSDSAKGQLYLQFAGNRLAEAKAIHTQPQLLRKALDDMDDETKLGVSLLTSDAVKRHNAASLDAVAAFVDSQRAGLNALIDLVGSDQPARTDAVLEVPVLDKAALRVHDLRTALGCSTIALVNTDELGPEPATACQE